MNRQAIQYMAVQAIVVIQKTHHTHLVAVDHGRCQLPACTARAINQQLWQGRFFDLVLIQTTQPNSGRSA